MKNGAPSSEAIAALIVLFFLLAWEASVRCSDSSLPVARPSLVLQTLASQPQMYLQATLITLGEALSGLALGGLAGASLPACSPCNPTWKACDDPGLLIKSTRWWPLPPC